MSNAAGMPCPVCKIPLVMSERQGVEIDYCSQCRGVWLDRGELDKIVQRSAAELAPAPAPTAPQPAPGYGHQQAGYGQQQSGYGHQQAGYGQGYPNKKRKKSFFEEIFD